MLLTTFPNCSAAFFTDLMNPGASFRVSNLGHGFFVCFKSNFPRNSEVRRLYSDSRALYNPMTTRCMVPIGSQMSMTMDERAKHLRKHTRSFTEKDIKEKFNKNVRA